MLGSFRAVKLRKDGRYCDEWNLLITAAVRHTCSVSRSGVTRVSYLFLIRDSLLFVSYFSAKQEPKRGSILCQCLLSRDKSLAKRAPLSLTKRL